MNPNRKSKKEGKRQILLQRKYGIPIIVYTMIRCLAECALTILFLINVFSYFHYEIHHEEYWFFRFFILPFMYAGWEFYLTPCWVGSSLSCIEGILMIVGVSVPERMREGKKRFAAIFSYIAFVHMILNVLSAIGYCLMGILISFDETNLITEFFGLRSPTGMSALIGSTILASAISFFVMNRILKVKTEKEKDANIVDTKPVSSKEDARSKDSLENGSLKNRKKSTSKITVFSNISLVTGIVSAACQTAMLVLMLILGVWKKHPGLLCLSVLGILPVGGIVISIISIIQSTRKRRNNLRVKSSVGIALNGYSLLPAIGMFCLIVLCLFRMFFTGSPLSGKDRTLFALEDKYGEEFILVSDQYAAPKNNPELVFPVHNTYAGDPYHKAYVASMLEEKLRTDLQEYYPDAFLYIDPEGARVYWEEEFEFRGTSLKENLEKAEDNDFSNKYSYHCYVEIMLNKEKGTPGKYEEEYRYFSEQLLQDVANYEMLPVTVEYLWVDGATIERAKTYLKKYPYDLSGRMDEEVWGFRYDFHGIDYEKGKLGNPPQIAANFYPPDTAGSEMTSKEQFIYLRTLLESK